MDVQLLEDAGLTHTQARTYKALIQNGPCTAPRIAPQVDESRSNTYKVLDKLCALGLASKERQGKKSYYIAASPSALETLAQQRAARVDSQQRKLKAALPDLLQFFFAHSEQPSIRFFQGKEGIQHIFADMLQTGQDIYLLRSPEDVNFYDEAFFAGFRKRRALLGITTYALTPNVPSAVHDPQLDFKNKFIRTWLLPEAYTASVEWDIYGSKVALISYGKEAMGIIIESAQIAESMRQMFRLAQAAAIANEPAARRVRP